MSIVRKNSIGGGPPEVPESNSSDSLDGCIRRDCSPAPRLAFSVAEAATVSSISRSKLYELIRHGELGSIKIGRRRLIRRSDLMALLQAESAL